MFAEITAGLTALNALTDLGKNALDVATGEKVRTAVVAVREQLLNAQERALDAQARETALVKRVGELEQLVASFEDWDEQRARYQLENLLPGFFVYAIKPEARGTDPDHKLCAPCYQKRIKSFLNHDSGVSGETNWECPTCGAKGSSGTYRSRLSGPRSSPGGPDGWMA